MGRHPNSADGFDDAAADVLEELATHERVRAIGETGLDYYREAAPRGAQRRVRGADRGRAPRRAASGDPHARLARRHLRRSGVGGGRRDGDPALLFGSARARGRRRREGWHCSFAGNLTYPRSEQLREAARLVPDELLLVETDSPFLAPQPVRGSRTSRNVAETARRLAEIRDVSYQRLEETVEANAARLFSW